MVEFMRQDRRVVEKLFGGAATLIETSGSGAGPGRLTIKIGGRVVGDGATLREALTTSRISERTAQKKAAK
jgi:hypothetical protein